MMNKYIFYLVLSIFPLSISAYPTTTCASCTVLDFATINNTLIAQAWQTDDGTVWQFLSNGHAIASTPTQDEPLLAQWEWQRSDNCWQLNVISAKGNKYFQIPLTAAEYPVANAVVEMLQQSKSNQQLQTSMQQLQGEWKASLGRDAGVLQIGLHPNGRFDREHSTAQATTADAGHWTLSPDQRFIILFSEQGEQISTMRVPYVELDEMVLEPLADQGSWFFNRL